MGILLECSAEGVRDMAWRTIPCHQHRVESYRAMGGLRMRAEVILCCAHHTLLIGDVDSLGGKGMGFAKFYFNEGESIAAPRDEIDFADGRFVAPVNDAIGLQHQPQRRD